MQNDLSHIAKDNAQVNLGLPHMEASISPGQLCIQSCRSLGQQTTKDPYYVLVPS